MTSAELRRVFSNLPDEFKAALLERNAEQGTDFYVLVKQAEAEDLAAGHVPSTVIAMVRTMLDWQDQDRRNAARLETNQTKRWSHRKGKRWSHRKGTHDTGEDAGKGRKRHEPLPENVDE